MNQLEPEFTSQSKLIAGKPRWLRWVAARVILAIFVVLAAFSWELWDNRDESQISRILSQSPQLVMLTATESERFSIVEDWLRTLVFSEMAPYRRSYVMASIVEAVATSGREDEALTMAGRIGQADIRFRAIDGIIETLAKAGRTEEAGRIAGEALETVRLIRDADSRSRSMAEVLEVLAKAGRAAEASQVAGEALETTRLIKDPDYFDLGQ